MPGAERLSEPWLTLALLRRAARELGAHDPLRLGAATAFFTTFALPPIILILVQALGTLYASSVARAMLLAKLSALLGPTGAGLVEQILTNVGSLSAGRTRLLNILGFGFLLFIATTLFVVIQNSLNQLWRVRPARTTGRLRELARQRLRSARELLATGALAVTAFGLDAGLALLSSYTADFDATVGFYVFRGLNVALSWGLLAVWCGVTFRTLPSVRVPWPAVWRGALLTATLIEIGERVLGALLVPRNLGPVYGSASGVVLVLLFVFYSAIIFYFGAAFTTVWAHHHGYAVPPRPGAVRFRVVNEGT